jgi:hypothetical protein
MTSYYQLTTLLQFKYALQTDIRECVPDSIYLPRLTSRVIDINNLIAQLVEDLTDNKQDSTEYKLSEWKVNVGFEKGKIITVLQDYPGLHYLILSFDPEFKPEILTKNQWYVLSEVIKENSVSPEKYDWEIIVRLCDCYNSAFRII